MNEKGTLIHCDEAQEFIERIEDGITRSLVNLAFVHVVQKVIMDQREAPARDMDMLFLAKALKDFFAEKEVIARTLEGEQVGAWFSESD